MLCDICKKNEATIHIKEMHNNEWTSINICAECAKKKDLEAHAGMDEEEITKMLMNLTTLLGGQAANQKKMLQKQMQKKKLLKKNIQIILNLDMFQKSTTMSGIMLKSVVIVISPKA